MAHQFHERSSLALLAFQDAYTDLPGEPLQLSDGTWVLSRIPVDDDLDTWGEWLGSIRWNRVRNANLVLLAEKTTDYPEILGADHRSLFDDLGRLFCLLHLDTGVGTSEGEGAELLGGSSVRGIPEIRTVEQMPRFYRSQGSQRVPITRDWLERGLAHRTGHAELQAAEGEFERVLLGLDTLFKGKKEEIGADRLHQFVRSLEALVLPKQGKTRKQFGHRCQTFVRGGVDKGILKEAYDMRCATEHLNQWDKAVEGYRPDQREAVCWQRTRQIEQSACDAYSRLLCNSDLREHFRTDDAIKQFWRLPDRQRCEVWGPAVDIEKELAP